MIVRFPTIEKGLITAKGKYASLGRNKILKYMNDWLLNFGSYFSIKKYKFVFAPRFIYYTRTFNIYIHCIFGYLFNKVIFEQTIHYKEVPSEDL